MLDQKGREVRPPNFQRDAVISLRGWCHPRTGELLVCRQFTPEEVKAYEKEAGHRTEEIGGKGRRKLKSKLMSVAAPKAKVLKEHPKASVDKKASDDEKALLKILEKEAKKRAKEEEKAAAEERKAKLLADAEAIFEASKAADEQPHEDEPEEPEDEEPEDEEPEDEEAEEEVEGGMRVEADDGLTAESIDPIQFDEDEEPEALPEDRAVNE